MTCIRLFLLFIPRIIFRFYFIFVPRYFLVTLRKLRLCSIRDGEFLFYYFIFFKKFEIFSIGIIPMLFVFRKIEE